MSSYFWDNTLGSGVQGMVFVFVANGQNDRYAVKVHRHREPYDRECAVYHRLRERGVAQEQGFHVPRFLRSNDEWMAIEMTIVTKPYVLDFAGAYLDGRPEFSEDTWAEWEERRREDCGERWTSVQGILREFEGIGVFMLDPSPGNIAFRD